MVKNKREKQDHLSAEAQKLRLKIHDGIDPRVGIYRPKEITLNEGMDAVMNKMIKLIPRINKSTRVLILNSGFGHMAHQLLTSKECKVDCVNYNDTQNEHNAKTISKLEERLQKKFNLEKNFFEDIPYPGETFDVILCQDTLMLTNDKLRVFREVQRTLKPEGRFVFSDALRSEDCSKDDMADLIKDLPVNELFSIDQYEKMARKAFLHKVYLLELPEQIKIHHQKLMDYLEKQPTKIKNNEAYSKYLDIEKKWNDTLSTDHIDWGIFIFQKLND